MVIEKTKSVEIPQPENKINVPKEEKVLSIETEKPKTSP